MVLEYIPLVVNCGPVSSVWAIEGIEHAVSCVAWLPTGLLLLLLQDIAVSSGSACTSASLEPSYVLRALGVEEDMAHTSIRWGGSFGEGGD